MDNKLVNHERKEERNHWNGIYRQSKCIQKGLFNACSSDEMNVLVFRPRELAK